MSIWKDAKHHMSLKKCKVKWDTTTHLLERQKSGILITPNVGKNVKQEELSFLVGMQNDTATLEDNAVFSHTHNKKPKTYSKIQEPCSLKFIQRIWKYMSTQNPVHGFYSNVIHNC